MKLPLWYQNTITSTDFLNLFQNLLKLMDIFKGIQKTKEMFWLWGYYLAPQWMRLLTISELGCSNSSGPKERT